MSGFLGKIFGEGVGAVLKPVSDILDDVITNKEEKAAAAAKIQELLNQRETMIQEEWTKREGQLLADTASARDMQKAALAQEDKFSKRFVYYFITAWSLFSMTFLVGVTFFQIPDSSTRFADTVLGFLLGTAIASVFQFMVGSTRGSGQKNDALIDLAKAKSISKPADGA